MILPLAPDDTLDKATRRALHLLKYVDDLAEHYRIPAVPVDLKDLAFLIFTTLEIQNILKEEAERVVAMGKFTMGLPKEES